MKSSAFGGGIGKRPRFFCVFFNGMICERKSYLIKERGNLEKMVEVSPENIFEC